jgi:cyclohexanone monooxygenase
MTTTTIAPEAGAASATTGAGKPDFDAIAIGPGFAGHRAHPLPARGRVFGSACLTALPMLAGPGHGTAIRRRDGQRELCLTFSKEILQEWKWTQRYPGRAQTQAYMRFVVNSATWCTSS